MLLQYLQRQFELNVGNEANKNVMTGTRVNLDFHMENDHHCYKVQGQLFEKTARMTIVRAIENTYFAIQIKSLYSKLLFFVIVFLLLIFPCVYACFFFNVASPLKNGRGDVRFMLLYICFLTTTNRFTQLMKERNLFQELIYPPGPANHRNGQLRALRRLNLATFFKIQNFSYCCLAYFIFYLSVQTAF